MILLDANIFMYAAGADHPHKIPSINFLERVARGEVEAAIDAEVLQEILHRYRSIGRWVEGRQVYDSARLIVPMVLPITAEIVDTARSLMAAYEGLSARDAVHAAAALRNGARAICSFDRDFDPVAGLVRLEPPSPRIG